MNILHVIGTLSPRFGGPVVVCRELAQFTAELGHRVEIFSTSEDFPSGKMPVALGVKEATHGYCVTYFPCEFGPYHFSTALYKGLAKALPRFDIVHIHCLYRFHGLIAGFLARRLGVPYVIMPHGSLDPYLYHNPRHRRMKRIYENYLEFPNLNAAAAIHYTSEDERDLVAPLGLKAPAWILPNGINPRRFLHLPLRGAFRKKHHLKEHHQLALFLGRLHFKKGLDILIPAFSKVAATRPNLRLILAGPDNQNYSKQLFAWAKETGVADKIIFTGMLEGLELMELLADADFFTLPSHSENFGLVVAEAMSVGLPVAISNKVNIYGDLEKAQAGLVHDDTTDATAEALARLADDEGLRKDLAHRGKQLVTDLYDWRSIVPHLIAGYQKLIRGESPS